LKLIIEAVYADRHFAQHSVDHFIYFFDRPFEGMHIEVIAEKEFVHFVWSIHQWLRNFFHPRGIKESTIYITFQVGKVQFQ